MPYEKQDWEDLPEETTPISAARLAHMETQYEEAMADMGGADIGGDILADRGGVLTRRGQTIYQHDFSDGYGGWLPVFNAGGSEAPRDMLSLVGWPAKAMRVAAHGAPSGAQVTTDAILRMTRPFTEDTVVSFSGRFAQFEELNPAGDSAVRHLGSVMIGLDTQGWSNEERQFFVMEVRPGGSLTEVDASLINLRTYRDSTIHYMNVNTNLIKNVRQGQNENKVNSSYFRLTVRYGEQPDYIEAQMGGQTVDLRGMAPQISEPTQFSEANFSASFRGGMNPFLGVRTSSGALGVDAVGIYVTDLRVTAGDVL